MSTAQHTGTFILLHGRDSNASEFAMELFESQASDGRTLPQIFPGFKWVFPTADLVDSVRFGVPLSQWFDMYTTENPHEREAEQDLSASIARVQEVVIEEAAVIGASNIVLGGISQGCAVASHVLLRQGLALGGFIGFCGWLPQAELLDHVANSHARETPVFLAHSEDDEVMAIRFGAKMRNLLKGLGMDVSWHSYSDGGHWINEPKGVNDLMLFIGQNIPKTHASAHIFQDSPELSSG